MKKLISIALALTFLLPLVAIGISPPTWQGDTEFTPLSIPLDPAVQEFTYYLCNEYGVDFRLVLAIVATESAYQPTVVSRTGSYGLMQIHKINHGWLSDNLGITDFLDPYQNIRAGVYIVADLFDKYGTMEKVLMAYNLGEGGAKALWRGGVYETTYVRAVMKNMEELA